MTLRFGTDGVRGIANDELTPELVVALGRAAARVLAADEFVIGRDTRESGPMLEAALVAGITAEGKRVLDAGVIPTPAVAAFSHDRQCAGAMISASHNPYRDNGIKFFAPGGKKLPDDVEERLEAELDRLLHQGRRGGDVGVVESLDGASLRYVRRLLGAAGSPPAELPLVVDCANGAASHVAALLFPWALVINAEPDGRNINHECGSTHPQELQRAVVERRAALGLALDGDADRVIAVDEAGNLVDGDHLLALFAADLKARGRLNGDTLVVTVMSNLGLRLAMRDAGIRVVETNVGDRYVLEAMEAGGYSLGGEQSGHVIFSEHATTGDGLLAGVLLVDLVHRSGRPLGDLARDAMTPLPQTLENVRVATRDLEGAAEVWAEVAAVESELGDTGRVLLRPSGTEPLVRVMVEAVTQAQADAAARRLADVVARVLGP